MPAATERDEISTVSAEGEAEMEALLGRLTERAGEPDVQAFIDTIQGGYGLTQVRKPACLRVLWRGVVVCSHMVPRLNAWAESTGDAVLIWPLAGCGSYQTSTKASAGTHAGGGAVDVNANPHSPLQRTMVITNARKVGLQIGWFRAYRSGVWTNHYHVLDPNCPQLASVAAAQCVECFNGGDGLVGTKPDDGYRGNITQLKTIFANRLYEAVSDIGDTVTEIGKAAIDAERVKGLQTVVKQPLTGRWDIETDYPLGEIRATAKEGYVGKAFKSWSLAKRKNAQRVWGAYADGIWGPDTQKKAMAAARRVQGILSVPVDGIWGSQTDTAYLALRSRTYRQFRFSRPTGTYPRPGGATSCYGPSRAGAAWYSGRAAGVLPKSTIQWQIKRIQRMVGASADGIYGDATVEAVLAWQRANKVPADGIVGKATWDAMVKANVR
jgi:peptidoglycan hydrolase-like protein with peptidoglycan-binding domain